MILALDVFRIKLVKRKNCGGITFKTLKHNTIPELPWEHVALMDG